MNRQYRKVLPLPFLILFCVIYLLTYSIDFYFFIRFGVNISLEVNSIRILILVISSAVYGFFRVRAFHPFYNKKYWQWLCLSPWSFEKPLPQGSIHLIWPDFILLTVSAFLAYSNVPQFTVTPVLSFLAVYIIILLYTFLADQSLYIILLLFLAPFTYYPFKNLYFALLVLIVLYILCYQALHQFLKGFPWNTKYWRIDELKEFKKHALRHNTIGWPFKYLNVYDIPKISLLHTLLLSLLLTWWIHVVRWFINEPYFFGFLGMISVFIAFFRTLIYVNSCSPPISFMGRIFIGRLIIPGYDKIFIAPICILLIGFFLPIALDTCGFSEVWNYELSFFLLFFLAFAMPPKLKDWRLTGSYRICHHVQSGNQKPPNPKEQEVIQTVMEKFGYNQ